MAAREAMGYGLVPPRDPASLRTAVKKLLMDVAEREQLAQKGRRYAVEAFGRDAAARGLVKVYGDALSA